MSQSFLLVTNRKHPHQVSRHYICKARKKLFPGLHALAKKYEKKLTCFDPNISFSDNDDENFFRKHEMTSNALKPNHHLSEPFKKLTIWSSLSIFQEAEACVKFHTIVLQKKSRTQWTSPTDLAILILHETYSIHWLSNYWWTVYMIP